MKSAFSKVVLFSVLALSFLLSPIPVSAASVSEAQSYRETLLTLLRNRDFAALDAALTELQQRYKSDTNAEVNLGRALQVFYSPDPGLTAPLDEWRRKSPDSYAALTASGQHYMAVSWAWRGTESANRTHPRRMEKMEEYRSLAHRMFTESLPLTNVPVVSLAELIELEKLAGEREAARTWLTEAEKLDPSNKLPRRAYMGMLLPRWGGSYKEMEDFAARVAAGARDDKARKVSQFLAVQPLVDRANLEWRQNNLVTALELYEEAASSSGSKGFLVSRAKLLSGLGQFDSAMKLFDQALASDPDDSEALYYRSQTLFKMQRSEEGAHDLLRAAEAGDINAWTDWGIVLLKGQYGIPADPARGLAWISQAASYWDVRAVFMLGKAYELGLSVTADAAQAVHYYKLAAIQDYGPAQNDLGLLYWYGRGATEDQGHAIRLWKQGHQKGLWQSTHNLEFFLTPVQRATVFVTDPLNYYFLIRPLEVVGLIAIWGLIALLIYLRAGRRPGQPS